MKTLYSFALDKEELVDDVTTSTDEAGNETKVTKKVTKKVPRNYQLARPTRSLVDASELFFGAKLNEAITKHNLIPKRLLIKIYDEKGGYITDEEKQKRDALQKRFLELQEQLLRDSAKPDEEKTPEEKEISNKIQDDFLKVYDELRIIEQDYQNLFEYTAEAWAKRQTMIWWVLSLAHKEQDGKTVPYFEGKNFDEKLKFYDALSEKEDAFENKVVERFVFLIGFWYNGRANNKEDFDNALKLMENAPQS